MQYLLITNNPKVNQRLQGQIEIEFYEDGSHLDILKKVRGLVHEGYQLETHPLSGSIKPNETPYKSIIVSLPSGKITDLNGAMIMEDAIHTAEKFIQNKKTPVWIPRVLEDFSEIDYALISGTIERLL